MPMPVLVSSMPMPSNAVIHSTLICSCGGLLATFW
jgi:hypothetical protein